MAFLIIVNPQSIATFAKTIALETNPKALIFDCDGVLVDTETISTATLHQMATENGVPLSLEETRHHYIGKALSVVFEDMEKRLGSKLPDTFENEFRNRSFEAFKSGLKPIEGIEDLLQEFESFPKAVASNGPSFKMELTLDICNLKHHFDPHIYSAYTIQKWKPEPDLFWHAAKKLGYPPNQCVIIEDSQSGVQAAVAGGFKVYAFAPKEMWKAYQELGAIPFDSMKELSNLI